MRISTNPASAASSDQIPTSGTTLNVEVEIAGFDVCADVVGGLTVALFELSVSLVRLTRDVVLASSLTAVLEGAEIIAVSAWAALEITTAVINTT